MEPPPLPRVPQPPTLAYGRADEPRLRVMDYLIQTLAAAVFMGVFVSLMAVAGRYRQVFVDFNLKLPASTQLVLDVQSWFDGCYLWLALWVIPPVFPLLLARLRPEARRWLMLLGMLLAVALLAFVCIAVFIPILTLYEGVSNRK